MAVSPDNTTDPLPKMGETFLTFGDLAIYMDRMRAAAIQGAPHFDDHAASAALYAVARVWDLVVLRHLAGITDPISMATQLARMENWLATATSAQGVVNALQQFDAEFRVWYNELWNAAVHAARSALAGVSEERLQEALNPLVAHLQTLSQYLCGSTEFSDPHLMGDRGGLEFVVGNRITSLEDSLGLRIAALEERVRALEDDGGGEPSDTAFNELEVDALRELTTWRLSDGHWGWTIVRLIQRMVMNDPPNAAATLGAELRFSGHLILGVLRDWWVFYEDNQAMIHERLDGIGALATRIGRLETMPFGVFSAMVAASSEEGKQTEGQAVFDWMEAIIDYMG